MRTEHIFKFSTQRILANSLRVLWTLAEIFHLATFWPLRGGRAVDEFSTWRLLGHLEVVGQLAKFSTWQLLGHYGVVGHFVRFSPWRLFGHLGVVGSWRDFALGDFWAT